MHKILQSQVENLEKTEEPREVLISIFKEIASDLRDLRSDVNNHAKRLLTMEKELKERKEFASPEDKRRRILSDPAPKKYSLEAQVQAARAKITRPSLQRWSWSTIKQRYVHLKRSSPYEEYTEDPKCTCDVCINGALWDNDQKACEIVIEFD